MTYTGVLLRLVIFPQRHIQAVHEQERIQLLQRSVLPLLQLFQHAVCDVGLVCSSLSFFLFYHIPPLLVTHFILHSLDF